MIQIDLSNQGYKPKAPACRGHRYWDGFICSKEKILFLIK